MPVEVLMPALSPTMEKGNLSKWMKSEGDKVKAGDVIAEIETDKATMEVEAVDEGTLGKILVPEGTADVAVNTPIAVILSDGESASDIRAPGPATRQKVEESETRVEETSAVVAPAVISPALPNPETIEQLDVPEGTADVAVNTPIAVILGEGESASDIKASAAPAAPQKAAEAAPAPHPEEPAQPAASRRTRPVLRMP